MHSFEKIIPKDEEGEKLWMEENPKPHCNWLSIIVMLATATHPDISYAYKTSQPV